MNNYLNYMHQCQIAKNFCEWIKSYQKTVWHRIGYSRSIKGMKVYETVITQNLVFDLALKKLQGVKILESTNERKNGSDMLIEINCGGKIKKLAVQAKIAYKNESFPMVDHEVEGEQQIDRLLRYANANDYNPAYMFYGYSKSSNNSDYGISIAGASYIKKQYFSSPPAVTIPNMGDVLKRKKFVTAYDELCCQSGNHIFEYKENQKFTENPNIWKAIDDQVLDEKLLFSEEFGGFNPAYLIQVSKD